MVARRPRLPFWGWIAVLVVAGVVAVVWVAYPRPPAAPRAYFGTSAGPPASCNATNRNFPDPTGPHGLFVLDPPANPHGAGYSQVAEYLQNNSLACGADFWVHWSDIDRGPGASPRYNFTALTTEMQPWVAAGKIVNLIFWPVGYGPNTTYVPPTVLAHVGTVQCGDSPVTPYYWERPFVQNYSAFIRATVSFFNDSPSIGYLRFGLGTGGETLPLYDLTAPGCGAALNATGYTTTIWDNYLEGMIDFEGSLHSAHPLMVALDGGFGGPTDHTFSDIAQWAVHAGLGFGSEAITGSTLQFDAAGNPACGSSGFCALFNEYSGQAPLEIQTEGPSAPNGAPPVGSLVPILNYTLAEHAQIFEIYAQDWQTAFDPAAPDYPAYHTQYADALGTVAAVVG
jgi:hypothetical protein